MLFNLAVVFSDQNEILPFLNYLNSKHNNIKFTCESEINNSLNFLDMIISPFSRNNNKFGTSVFRKKTVTGLGVIRYDSFIHSYIL